MLGMVFGLLAILGVLTIRPIRFNIETERRLETLERERAERIVRDIETQMKRTVRRK